MTINAIRSIALATLFACNFQVEVQAHGDEDHGTAPQAVSASHDKPQRLPDGRVLLPKEAQHRMEVRTQRAVEGSAFRTVELNGHVVMDPNRGGRVQASGGGRIEAPENGLPMLGSKIRKGQILAWARPAVGSYETAQRRADLAEIRAKISLAQQQVARLTELIGSVPRKDLEAAQMELGALRKRSAALTTATLGEALRSPVDGILAANKVVSGQVVSSSDILFEIVDPHGMLIEALAYDPGLIGNIAGASLQGGRLRYVGGAKSLRDGALPLQFAPVESLPLALGQTVKIVVQTREKTKGVSLPASSVVKNSANESVIWLHERALVFRAVPVQPQPLDGKHVLITDIKSGSRVVTQGATLINQIR